MNQINCILKTDCNRWQQLAIAPAALTMNVCCLFALRAEGSQLVGHSELSARR